LLRTQDSNLEQQGQNLPCYRLHQYASKVLLLRLFEARRSRLGDQRRTICAQVGTAGVTRSRIPASAGVRSPLA